MNLNNFRSDTARLQQQAAGMRLAGSLLQDLADVVSKGRPDTVDVPRQLRRIAASLESGAESLQHLSGRSDPGPWHSCFRDEVHGLRMQLREKLRSRETRGEPWPAESAARLQEMEQLLRQVFEICGELAAAEPICPGRHVAILGGSSAAPQYC